MFTFEVIINSMENLNITASDKSPFVEFNLANSHFIIRGTSLMEDAKPFYNHLISWIQDYVKVATPTSNFEFQFTHLNQASLKMLLFLCQEIRAILKSNKKVSVTWLYPESNIQIKEFGMDVSYMSDLPFKFEALKAVQKAVLA